MGGWVSVSGHPRVRSLEASYQMQLIHRLNGESASAVYVVPSTNLWSASRPNTASA